MKPQEHPLQRFKTAIEPMGFRIEGIGYNGSVLLVHVAGGPKPGMEVWDEVQEKHRAGILETREGIQAGEDLRINQKLQEEIERLKKETKARHLMTVGDREITLSKFSGPDRIAAIELAFNAFLKQHPQIPNVTHKIGD